ncbi:hypothetical protein KY290_025845 [Solanum tuberosum]|uniref:C2 domain-containing protein n=1 Tax=Solanum tuberosum TaxID=4113 RepID=A0ABQ7UXU0_SOLTU|nr:hypothetical protein KY290_025845 [Solanum tuberosum]
MDPTTTTNLVIPTPQSSSLSYQPTPNNNNSHILEITLISAQDLAPVSKSLRTYALTWINPNRKRSTKVDNEGHNNPTWNDKFSFKVNEEFLYSENSAVHVEIYTVSWPSGNPQGILNMGVAIIESSMRSMPLICKEIMDPTSLDYRDILDKKMSENYQEVVDDDKQRELNEKVQLWRSMSLGYSEVNNDEFPIKGGSICNGSMANGSMVNGSELCSDVGPSASIVAAEIAAKRYEQLLSTVQPEPRQKVETKKSKEMEDGESSLILEDLTAEEAYAKGLLSSNREKLRKETIATQTQVINGGHARRNSDGGGLFSCFGNAVTDYNYVEIEPQSFTLPSPIPQWPQGKGFAQGKICLGEIEAVQITKFKKIWSCTPLFGKSKSVSFYKPDEIPQGFSIVGHYCQPDGVKNITGYVLAVKDLKPKKSLQDAASKLPALAKPMNYTLVYNANGLYKEVGYIWLPNAPVGYKAMGFVATAEPNEPNLDEVKCVRADLTESCETCEVVYSANSIFAKRQFQVWKTRPCMRGMLCRGVSVGTFFCSTSFTKGDDLTVACLKNFDSSLQAMPNLEQVHALIKHYGPTVYFHPDEIYLPSSVPWFFSNGALLFKDGKDSGIAIDAKGSNLPAGGRNDGKYWLDLPNKDVENRQTVKCGKIETAELYVHVKPAEGGTFTDIAMWIFFPFNGPATLKVGLMNLSLNKVGEHVCDWEHYTLRISNFSGELCSVYFSEHSGGEWVDACDLEFIEGNKSVVYASRNGHASFPHPGCYLQGNTKLGIGARNDCAKSKHYVDSSSKYRIIAAEYLGEGTVVEPPWLQYMREWGPTIEYKSGYEVDEIIKHLPSFFRFSVETLIELFPTELYGEAGPTGPKEKNNWFGDERW